MPDYILGVDLGKTHDYTAVIVLEVAGAGQERQYQARHMERLRVGTPYPEQVDRIAELYHRLKGAPLTAGERFELAQLGVTARRIPQVDLVVDQTGVGQAVVDMMRARDLPAKAVTITGGDATTQPGHHTYRVPKRDLVGCLQVVMQTRRLRLAGRNPLAKQLADEMLAFKVSINQRGHDTYGNDWRENAHDDLVLAAALAVWYGETQHREPRFLML